MWLLTSVLDRHKLTKKQIIRFYKITSRFRNGAAINSRCLSSRLTNPTDLASILFGTRFAPEK